MIDFERKKFDFYKCELLSPIFLRMDLNFLGEKKNIKETKAFLKENSRSPHV